jgi:hypothetical protein
LDKTEENTNSLEMFGGKLSGEKITSGSFHPEWVAVFVRNDWQLSPEQVAVLARNTQYGNEVGRS